MQATVIEQRELGAELRWMVLGAPGLASAQPGQLVMLRCSAAESEDPFLRRPLFLADADARAGTVSLLYSTAGRATRWLAGLGPGAQLDLLGPLGRPLKTGAARHMLLIAEGWGVAPLLFLARRSSGRSTLLIHRPPAPELALPPFLLPPEVEYLVEAHDPVELLGRPLGPGGTAPLAWSDLLVGAGDATLAGALRQHVTTARTRWKEGFAQFVLVAPLPCGVGLCGGCRYQGAGGHGETLLCLDGPALDLKHV